jgi:hypothetical protein
MSIRKFVAVATIGLGLAAGLTVTGAVTASASTTAVTEGHRWS